MDVLGFLEKAAEDCGFSRERFDPAFVPTDGEDITVCVFFGDIRSALVLSSLLLHRLRSEERGSKYFILCSWPGFESLFPYVSEYWGLRSEMGSLYAGAAGFSNSLVVEPCRRLTSRFFKDVVFAEDCFSDVYGNGILNGFWERYRDIRRFLPAVPPTSCLSKEFNRDAAMRGGYKVFVFPSLYCQTWRRGRLSQQAVSRQFWLYFLGRLVDAGFAPMVYWGDLAHDVSADMGSKCVYLNESSMGAAMAAMRLIGCAVDVFSGISRLAIAARCPFVAVDDRARYFAMREYEIDDLCGSGVPRRYIFTTSTIIESGPESLWSVVADSVIAKLKDFLPSLSRESWPSTGQIEDVVSYDIVRRRDVKRMGVRLLKVPKI